jgi:hypothetical protein
MSRNTKITRTGDEVSLDTAVQFVLSHVPRSQLLEMYYWTQEEDILHIVRGLITLPLQTRQELLMFLDQLQAPRALAQAVEDEELVADDAKKSHLLPH